MQHQDLSGQTLSFGGTEFEVIDSIYKGAEGITYQARVKKVTPPSLMQINDEVVLKRQIMPKDTNQALTQYMTVQQMDILRREGTLLSNNKTTLSDGTIMYDIVMPLFPGKGLDAIFRDIDNKSSPITANQRNNIAYSLIRDHFAHQLLGIVHCDLKPDNILCDLDSGTAKIIDVGMAFDLRNENPNTKLSTAATYAPPDQPGRNNPKTEEYTLGLIIAQLYAKNHYDIDEFYIKFDEIRKETPTAKGRLTDEQRNVIQAKTFQALMGDVIGDTKPSHMPDDIYQIVKHLTETDSNRRPENLALAQGIEHSKKLPDLRKIQIESEILRDSLKDSTVHLVNGLSDKEFKSYGEQLELQRVLKKLSTLTKSSDSENFNNELKKYSKNDALSKRDRKAFTQLAKKKIGSEEKLQRLHSHIKKDKSYFVAKMWHILDTHHDPMTIRTELNSLKKEIPNTKNMQSLNGKIDDITLRLSQFGHNQAKIIQAKRSEAISQNKASVAIAATDTPDLILRDLQKLANNHRIPSGKDQALTFSFGASYQYDDIGKLINTTAQRLDAKTPPDFMRLQLTQLIRNLAIKGPHETLDQVKNLMSRLDDISASGNLKQKPEIKISPK